MDRKKSALMPQRSLHFDLAAAAALLSALAAIVGDPGPQASAAAKCGADLDALARVIAAEKDHVTALELAEWIRDGRPGLRVIDVRPGAEREEEKLPTAEIIDLSALVTTTFRPADTIVLYSEEGVHAGQAWVLLRAMGFRSVFFLRGGSRAWLDEVMNPALEEGGSVEAERAFARAAELSRYFGGSPRVGARRPSGTEADKAKSAPPPALVPRRPRGC